MLLFFLSFRMRKKQNKKLLQITFTFSCNKYIVKKVFYRKKLGSWTEKEWYQLYKILYLNFTIRRVFTYHFFFSLPLFFLTFDASFFSYFEFILTTFLLLFWPLYKTLNKIFWYLRVEVKQLCLTRFKLKFQALKRFLKYKFCLISKPTSNLKSFTYVNRLKLGIENQIAKQKKTRNWKGGN